MGMNMMVFMLLALLLLLPSNKVLKDLFWFQFKYCLKIFISLLFFYSFHFILAITITWYNPCYVSLSLTYVNIAQIVIVIVIVLVVVVLRANYSRFCLIRCLENILRPNITQCGSTGVIFDFFKFVFWRMKKEKNL